VAAADETLGVQAPTIHVSFILRSPKSACLLQPADSFHIVIHSLWMKLRLFRNGIDARSGGAGAGREGQADLVPGVVPVERGHLTNDHARAVLGISGTA
jgi:hypothetical protein